MHEADSEEEPRILILEPGRYLAAAWRNMYFVYWMSQGKADAVQRLRAALERAHEGAPGMSSTVHLIRDGAGLPEPDVRAAVLAMSSHFAPRTACLAVVLMGAGFWASALQSVLTALRMLAPNRSGVMRFSREPAELCDWFPMEHTRRTAQYIDRAGLAHIVERVLATGDAAR